MSTGWGSWVTPYVMDPVNHLVLYYGDDYGNIYKTTNGGNTWSLKNANFGNSIFSIAVAPSNTDYMYACSLNKIKISADAGSNWTEITGDVPHDGIGFNYLAVSNVNPEEIWVALSGYSEGEKIFYSDDAGAPWINISGSLPNVPVNTMYMKTILPMEFISALISAYFIRIA